MNAQTKPDPSHILEATMNAVHSNHFAPQACHSYSIKSNTEAGSLSKHASTSTNTWYSQLVSA